jgi:AcrR family transcriptional regulator
MTVRADAQRNYDRLLTAARAVFRERGTDAPLDEVARRAGVGAGTLYRHFPTRDDLLSALMQAWVERLDTAAAGAIDSAAPPRERLLTWLRGCVAEISYSRGAAARLTAAIGVDDSPLSAKAAAFTAVNDRVLEALAGHVRPGVDGVQLARLVGGVAMTADQASLDASVLEPLLAVVADGILVAG